MRQTSEKKAHIINVAEALFSEKGFEGTSIRDLSTRAEINIAMVNYYFGTKEKLFEALINDRVDYKKEEMDELVKDKSQNAVQKISQLIDLYVEKIFHNTRFNVVMQREASLLQRTDLTNKISEALMSTVNNIRKVVTEGQKGGLFKDGIDVDMCILIIMGAVSQVTYNRLIAEKVLKSDIDNEKKKAVLMERVKKHLKEITLDYLKK